MIEEKAQGDLVGVVTELVRWAMLSRLNLVNEHRGTTRRRAMIPSRA